MMYSNAHPTIRSVWNQLFFPFFGGDAWSWGLTVGLLPVITWINSAATVQFNSTYYQTITSLADCFVVQQEQSAFLLFTIPLFLLTTQLGRRHDFSSLFILKRHSKRRIFAAQSLKIVLYAFLFSLYDTICTALTGSFLVPSTTNWHRADSLYYLTTESVNTSASLWGIAISFFLTVFIRLSCMGLLFLLVWWLSKKSILSWILAMSVLCWDIFFPRLAIIPGRASISYLCWKHHTIVGGSAVVIGIGILLFIIGYWLSVRKEFLGEKHTDG